MEFPAEYMFKNVPKDLPTSDPVSVTLHEMDRFGIQAHEHGFHVSLVTDAMTDLNPAAHENTISNIFPMLGETGTTSDILVFLG